MALPSIAGKRRVQRRALLLALYEAAEGRERFNIAPIQYLALASQIGLDQEVTGQTIRFLVSDGLLAYKPASEVVSLTHQGVIEAEQLADEDASSVVAEDDHRKFAVMAIEEARQSISEDGRTHPKVGVVVVKDGRVLATAHRGEVPEGHAEFIALEKKLAEVSVVGATVYATLEPCTSRNHPKVPCANRLAEREVARVYIGMLDPNPDIRGLGQQRLREAGIETQLFPPELMAEVEELNRDFIRAQKQRQQRSAQLVETELQMSANDPRVYVTIKEPTEGMFPRTPFVLNNKGGDVAHRVKLEMPWKLNHRNVSFEAVETIQVGESRESLPTIDEEGLTTKHNIFHWLLQDWNGPTRGISEEWPRPLTVRYEDFSGRKKFEISMTLMFYPIKYMLKSKDSFPSWRHYRTWEFRDIVFKRVT
jgi:pyrimidine deaminase RibD-like protein